MRCLRNNLKSFHNVEIINQDILKLNLENYFRKADNELKLKVFGNIPYYISTPIIERLLKARDSLSGIFITVQKEFAQRITAVPGSKDYGSLTCFVQYYTRPEICLNIKKTCFSPRPKVDSCLLRLSIRGAPCVEPRDEGLFFKIIRAGFNKRRKTLRNSLSGVVAQQDLERFFAKYGIDSRVRPENLSLEDFANLSNI